MLDELEKSSLYELINTDGYKAIRKLLSELSNQQALFVLKYDVDSGDADTLLRHRCKADGAARLLKDLDQYIQGFKKKYNG